MDVPRDHLLAEKVCDDRADSEENPEWNLGLHVLVFARKNECRPDNGPDESSEKDGEKRKPPT